jgi:hypothetical protein
MRVRMQTKDGSKVLNLNRRKAIRERCLNCSGWSYSEVENCQITDCELHPFRMGTGKQNAQNRHKAIRNHCLDCCAGIQHEVLKCPAIDCPLYAYRKSKIDNTIQIDSIRKIGHMERPKKTLNSKSMSEYAVIK